jgi:acyl-CoA synthetase (NDP forming)
VIGLYIEMIRRGRAFMEAARRISRNKPIVAYYVGGSEAGKKAGLSHTGALAGPDRLYDGAFKQSGVIRAESMTELFDFCGVLGSCPLPQGKRLVIQTHSGGPGAAAADACGRMGLELPGFSTETLEKLAPLVPQTGSMNNPLDLTFNKNPLDYFDEIPRTLLADPGADSLLLYLMLPDQQMKRAFGQMGMPEDQIQEQLIQVVDQIAALVIKLPEEHRKPVIGYSFRARTDRLIRVLRDKGFPVLPSPERAARALSALVQYQSIKGSSD